MHRLSTLPIALAACLSTSAHGQTFEVVLMEGDFVPGAGTAGFFYDLAIDDQGGYLVEVDLDEDPGFGPMALVSSEGVAMSMGMTLAEPPGAVMGFPTSFGRTSTGGALVHTSLTPAGGFQTEGLYLDGLLFALLDEPAYLRWTAPGTVWDDMVDVSVGPNDHVLASVELLIGGVFPTKNALVAWEVEEGALVDGRVLVAEDDVPWGAVGGFSSFGPTKFGSAQRGGGGHTMFGATLKAPQPSSSNEVVCLNRRIVAQEGQPAPVAGKIWDDSLSVARMDVNPTGDWALLSRLAFGGDDDHLLVKNGQAFVQQGDSLPAIAPHALLGFSASSFIARDWIQMTNDGRVFWSGYWGEPGSFSESGLFLDEALIVTPGVPLGEYTLGPLVPETYRISNNGRWVLFHAALLGSGPTKRAVVRVDLGA
ncbi:MAG: hypothetical protein AAF682_12730 [Planctomycetota bacterium]